MAVFCFLNFLTNSENGVLMSVLSVNTLFLAIFCRPLLAQLDFRIQHCVQYIHHQVNQYEMQGKYKNQRLDCRIIPVVHGFNQKGTKSRKREHSFRHNGTAQKKTELKSHNRHNGYHTVTEHMLPDNRLFPQAFGPGRTHVILLQHLDDRGTGKTGNNGRNADSQRDGRQNQVLEGAGPGGGQQPVLDRKTMISMNPIQKEGMDIPETATVIPV